MRIGKSTLAYTEEEIEMGRVIANNVDPMAFLKTHADTFQRAIGAMMVVELAKLATVVDHPSATGEDAVTLASIADAGSAMIQILLHAGISCDTDAVLDELLKSMGPRKPSRVPKDDDGPPVAGDLCRKQLSLVRNERVANMHNPRDVLERAYVLGLTDLEGFTRHFLRMPTERRGTIWIDLVASSTDD